MWLFPEYLPWSGFVLGSINTWLLPVPQPPQTWSSPRPCEHPYHLTHCSGLTETPRFPSWTAFFLHICQVPGICFLIWSDSPTWTQWRSPVTASPSAHCRRSCPVLSSPKYPRPQQTPLNANPTAPPPSKSYLQTQPWGCLL